MPRDKQIDENRRQKNAPAQNGTGAGGSFPSSSAHNGPKEEPGATRSCAQCGKTMAHLGAFCQSCGAPLREGGHSHRTENRQDRAGDGPAAFILQSIKNSFYGFLGLCKKPVLLLPALLLAALWLGLSLAKTQFPAAWPIRILSFFTFAQGGMYAGLLGAVGGIAGKAFLAWFVTGIFFALKAKQKPFTDTAQKWRALWALFAVKRIGEAAMVIGGAGVALIAYNFLTGNGALENSVIGITAAAAAFRTLKKPKSFFKGLLLSFRRGKIAAAATDHAIAGLVLGFLFSVLISLLRTGWVWYLLGALLLLVAAILGLVGGGKKRAVGAGTVCLLFLLALPLGRAGAFADGGAWVLKETAHFEETESGASTWVEDDIVFSADCQTGAVPSPTLLTVKRTAIGATAKNAAGTVTYGELPQRIGGNESIEIPVTGAISKNEVGGGLFGVSFSMHCLAKPFTSLDDGFRDGEFSLRRRGGQLLDQRRPGRRNRQDKGSPKIPSASHRQQ